MLGFDAIELGFGDEVAVAAGYTATPFIQWGTPILGTFPDFVPGTPPLVPGGNTADQQAEQMGMDHDAMHYFPLERGPGGSERGLLVVNQENTHEGYLHTGTESAPAKSAWTEERGCEITGVITTPDQRTMFVNVQHPGEDGGSTRPQDDGLATPRSATVVITKADGGVIGT